MHFNPAKDIKLIVDASDLAVGGVLLQKEDSTWRSIAYFGQKLFNYSLITTNIETYISSNIEKIVIKTSLDVITFISAYVEPT